jgi:threonine dehydratase
VFSSLPLQTVEVDFVLETRDHEHVQQVIAALGEAGFKARLNND